MIVDLHSHFFPAEAANAARSSVRVEAGPSAGQTHLRVDGQDFIVPAAITDPATQAREATQAGLDARALLPPPFAVRYELDPDDGVDWSRRLNEGTAAAAASDPERLIGFASVPLQAGGERAAAELDYAIGSLGLRGVELLTSVCGTGLDAAQFDTFWAAVAELGVPVVIHPHYVAGAQHMRQYYLRNLVGNPTETALAGARLIYSGLLRRYPGLHVILCHGGGALPHIIGRLRHGFRSRPELRDAADPDEGLRRLFYDTVVFDPTVLRHLAELVGHRQLVVGSDYPFDMAEPRPAAFVADSGLSEQAVASVLHSADRLFAS
ncbi:amidohydrolase family protein [Rugosimonospora africana]|uniref:2-hydroxy-3-carboxy-6-oxo-7-methylocta-2,4-dienoa te decarboxylase n=1 Tax=Rugosimonospora africana TaxID=556532 RepID=A0A8J3VWH3_9ACTN|nr:amidohydrolase family protein [Rugosimonospora africana]GIH20934.1 2-hydroxy-3-carboxy-6-oxo-7-methylocta-2,4-dienoa te decarboxylase [Rugosimonospora africana]